MPKTIRKILENQAGIDGKPRMPLDQAEAEIKEIMKGCVPKEKYPIEGSGKISNMITAGHNACSQQTLKNMEGV